MSKRGVSKITGNASPKVGEATVYSITDWYPATPQSQRNAAAVTWELFKKRSNGRFTSTNIKKTGSGTFTFGEVAQRNTYRLEAYLYEPEGAGPTSIEINPQPVAIPRINRVELQYVDDTPGTVFSYSEKMRARAQCVNLTGQKLKFSLWEDDAVGDGHDANNLLIETKESTVDRSGVATAEFMLTRALMQKAMRGETDPQKLEFYVTVEYFSDRKHATDNVNVNNPSHAPATRPQTRPQSGNPASIPSPTTQSPPARNTPPRAQGSPAEAKPQSQKEEKGIVDTVTDWWNSLELWDWGESQGTIEPAQTPTQQPTGGRTVSVVQDSGVEELLDAYFAKKEYTKQTGEVAGSFEYTIGSNGNRSATAAEKERIAGIILGKASVKALAQKKEYTTLEAIKAGLTKDVYNKDEKVTFQTFKLGAEFKKVNSAPLDTKLYLVARTSGLNGKQATLIIKEKDGLLKGSAGTVLPILEITEAQMEQATPATGEVPGTEKSQFTATIENGMAKVPIHLRPKSNDELKIWKDKLTKGKEDGTYTYKFGGDNIIADEDAKKRIAATILRNAKNGNSNNTRIAEGKAAYADDIVAALQIKTYKKDETVTFKLYKKQPELLFIQAKAQGEKQHDKEFLKADGAYFEIAKKCPRCNAPVTAEQLKEIFTSASDDTLTKVAEAYTKYMAELEMNTCWNKAHFFAQAYVESGLSLHVRNGENFNYYYEGLSIFGAFQTEEGRRKARLWGRPVRTPSTPGVSLENQRNIANYAYSPPAAKAAELGNTGPDDGWDFRGKGLIQLTGRAAYEQANAYTSREGKDIITNPDLVISDISVAVISSMVFFKWKGINKMTYGKSDTLPISRKVGKEVGSSYTEKQNAFDQHTKITFKTAECRESDDGGAWKNPLASSQRTYYNSGGNHKEQNGAFGPVRSNSDGTKKNHQGLDLFAEVNTVCYACLDGEVVSYTNEGSDGYGNVLVLKVKGEDLRRAKRSYTHEFTDEVESGEGFDINAEFIYLRYAHLSSAAVTSGDVKAGDTICHTGDSGNASGVVNPHLHFEIAKSATSNGRGLQNRYNPAYFVRLDAIDEPLQTRVKNER